MVDIVRYQQLVVSLNLYLKFIIQTYFTRKLIAASKVAYTNKLYHIHSKYVSTSVFEPKSTGSIHLSRNRITLFNILLLSYCKFHIKVMNTNCIITNYILSTMSNSPVLVSQNNPPPLIQFQKHVLKHRTNISSSSKRHEASWCS